jgi:diguanylate cyclase (GGDEF)-like protein
MRSRPALPTSDRLSEAPQLPFVTALLFGCGGLALGTNVLLPVDGTNPPEVLGTLAVLSLACAVYALVRGSRFGGAEATVLLVPLMATVTVLTATTELPVAALGNGLVLPVVGAYTVWFVPGRLPRTIHLVGVAAWFVAIVMRGEGLAGLAVTVLLESLVAVEVLRRLRRRLEALSVTDALTGALNLRGVRDEAQRLLRRAGRYGKPLAVVVADLDDLRLVNNTYGHAAGDVLLESVCDHWRGHLRGNDVLGRTGGDEFVMLLPDTGEDEAETRMAELHETSPAGWSWGVASAQPGDDFAKVLELADERMYTRKARHHRDAAARGDEEAGR